MFIHLVHLNRYFPSTLAYYEHLSQAHFRVELEQILEDGQPSGSLPDTPGARIHCPYCDFTSRNIVDSVNHLGIKHEVEGLLRQRERQRKRALIMGIEGTPISQFIAREQDNTWPVEDTDDSIVELESETCEYCKQQFEDEDDLTIHIARVHFVDGLHSELLSVGWNPDEEDSVCPVCEENPGVEMEVK